MIRFLSKFDNFSQLVKECEDLVARVPFKNDINQLALQVKDPLVPDWYESCGSIISDNKIIIEHQYKYINPELKGTAIEEWITSLGDVYRTRLMYIPPKQTYTVHRDPNPRIHIPVISNPNCYMCFPDNGIMKYLPATGESYWVDTTLNHTFVNCSNVGRIHLVAVTKLRLDSV